MCRMSSQLGCRVHFYAHPQTLGYIRGYIQKTNLRVYPRIYSEETQRHTGGLFGTG